MKLAVLGAALAAAVSLTSCSAVVAPSPQPRSVTTGGTLTVEPDLAQEGSGAGPLRLDGGGGKLCASLRFGREYTEWEHILEPTADVTLAGWSLVGAENVAVGRGFVSELPRRVGATGFTPGFPPEQAVVDSRSIDWEGRRPAAGARLKAGTRSNFWLRVEVIEEVGRASYQGLRVHYTSDGQEYTVVSDAPTEFRLRCS